MVNDTTVCSNCVEWYGIYNNAHCKTCSITERCFEVLQLLLSRQVWWHTAEGCSSFAQLLYQPSAISTLSSTQQWWHAARQFSPPAQPATLIVIHSALKDCCATVLTIQHCDLPIIVVKLQTVCTDALFCDNTLWYCKVQNYVIVNCLLLNCSLL